MAHIELELSEDCINECGAGGMDVSDALEFWANEPAVAEQLATLSEADAAKLCTASGGWDDTQVGDLDTNLQRVLWMAACNAREDGGFAYLEAY